MNIRVIYLYTFLSIYMDVMRGKGSAIALEFGKESADILINYLQSKDKTNEVKN